MSEPDPDFVDQAIRAEFRRRGRGARRVLKEIDAHFAAWYATNPEMAEEFLSFMEESIAEMRSSISEP